MRPPPALDAQTEHVYVYVSVYELSKPRNLGTFVFFFRVGIRLEGPYALNKVAHRCCCMYKNIRLR